MAKKTLSKTKHAATSLIARTAASAVARNRRLGEDALRLIDRKHALIAESFYDIALSLQVLSRKEVYAALGVSSFAELVETKTSISRSLAFELLKLPQHYSREAAVALGRDKASALIAYVDATPAADAAETLAREDAVVAGAHVSALSAKAIEEEARKVRPRAKKKASPAEEQALSAAHALEARIERAAKKSDVLAMAVKKKGGWWVRVEVPAALASRLEVGRAK